MNEGQGTFIADTGDTTVPVVRVVPKEKNTVMVKEDILYRRISDMVWSVEYGSTILFGVSSRNTVARRIRTSLSPDNLTLVTVVVFIPEVLPLLRKIRSHRIVQEVLGSCKSSFYWDLELRHSMKS
jgi:hypothetical protein